MARMYTVDSAVPEMWTSGERRLYEVLRRSLSDEYHVIQPDPWRARADTGRIRTGQADYVIIHPRHGILILEVAGGHVTMRGITKRWYAKKPRDNKRSETMHIRDPFRQGSIAMLVLRDYLHQDGRTRQHATGYRVGYAVWFPDMERKHESAQSSHTPRAVTLDARNLKEPEHGLLRVYETIPSIDADEDLSPEAVRAIVGLLTPDYQITPSLAVRIWGEEASLKQLTAAQMERLRKMQHEPKLEIAGAAGTGKTVLALQTAWRLAEGGKDTLLVCGNQHLADWMRMLIRYDERTDKPLFDVKSVKELCLAMAKLNGWREREILPLQIRSDEAQRTLADNLSDNIRRMKRKHEPMPYDAIIMDEGEDIVHQLRNAIEGLLRDKQDGYFYFFYDEAQRIDLPDALKRKSRFLPTSYRLSGNCRNTRQIFDVMAEFNPELRQETFEGPDGEPIIFMDPLVASTHSSDDEREAEDAALQAALDYLIGEGKLKPEDVLVITCRSEEHSRWYRSARRTLGSYALRWLSDGQRPGFVALATIRSAKGLEAKAVVLAELDGLQREKQRDVLLYVAISRAMHRLVVLGESDSLGPRQPSLLSVLWPAESERQDVHLSSHPAPFRIFEVVGAALTELYPEVPGHNDKERNDVIQQRLDGLKDNYTRLDSGERIQYTDIATQVGYLQRHLPAHAYFLYRLLSLREAEPVRALLQMPKLAIMSLGAGPGTDIIGILKYLSEKDHFESPGALHLDCILVDAQPTWAGIWTALEHAMLRCTPAEIRSEYCAPVDAYDATTWTHTEKIASTDLFTLSYILSELYAGRDNAAPFFSRLFDTAREGSIFLVVDNPVERWHTWFRTFARAHSVKQIAVNPQPIGYRWGRTANQRKIWASSTGSGATRSKLRRRHGGSSGSQARALDDHLRQL